MAISPVQAVLYAGIAVAVAALLWGVLYARSWRRVLLAAGVAALALLAGGIAVFAGMGAFCVPPPGAACA